MHRPAGCHCLGSAPAQGQPFRRHRSERAAQGLCPYARGDEAFCRALGQLGIDRVRKERMMMMKVKQVLIPLDLLRKIADLLSCWDTSSEDCSLQCDHDNVLYAVLKKLLATEVRASYTKMIFAEDDGKRRDAQMEYLNRKDEFKYY